MAEGVWRTDLAMEAREAAKGEIPGVEMAREDADGAQIVRVKVKSEAGARALGKMRGTYVTIASAALCDGTAREAGALAARIAREIQALLPLGDGDGVLVAGLGNRNLTPDSLGPRAAGAVLATAHLRGAGNLRPVGVLSPGVTGETGLETEALLRAVCASFRPRAVLALDALASRSAERLLTTVQITDAGVAPGSGAGNRRAAVTQEALGLPVLALGVPTVIHASTILREALEYLAGETGAKLDARQLSETLGAGQMLVAPADSDERVRAAAALLSDAVNLALHAPLTLSDIRGLRM